MQSIEFNIPRNPCAFPICNRRLMSLSFGLLKYSSPNIWFTPFTKAYKHSIVVHSTILMYSSTLSEGDLYSSIRIVVMHLCNGERPLQTWLMCLSLGFRIQSMKMMQLIFNCFTFFPYCCFHARQVYNRRRRCNSFPLHLPLGWPFSYWAGDWWWCVTFYSPNICLQIRWWRIIPFSRNLCSFRTSFFDLIILVDFSVVSMHALK